MSKRASIPAPAAAAAAGHPVVERVRHHLGWHIAHLLGSMKLAVVLLVLLAMLTWLGTLAQIDRSTFDVQREYFESWFVIAKLPLSVWGNSLFTLRIPLPGAYPVMSLLFVNLLVGGMLRLRLRWRNTGVLITHLGIAFLLVAGFVKMHYSFSGSLALYETPADGNKLEQRVYQSSKFVSFHDYELVLMREVGDSIEERVVPESSLWPARDGKSVTLRTPDLPFTVQVHHWMDFCRALPKGPMVAAATPVVDGAFLKPESWPEGEQPRSEAEIAGCYVTVLGNGLGNGLGSGLGSGANGAAAERVDGILWGMPLLPHDRESYPFTFTMQGVRWGLDLRHVVFDLPYSVRLDKFQKLDHPGTMTPRDFRSFVTVDAGGQERAAQIFMNNPLRKDGYVVYQTNWGPQPRGGPPWYSVFEVSYNPSDMWPAIACGVIALGLLVHFLLKLYGFLQSSTRTSLSS
ncbi:MAG: cytochrome c biogenesis protein ResB [Planctomycetota bacterium]